jgi:SulP family sulfate permease
MRNTTESDDERLPPTPVSASSGSRQRRPSTGDVIAGLSVALVAVPQSLAYAELAGLPAEYGLYASAVPSMAAAFFVSSRQLQTGPVALTSLLTFGALSPLAATFSPDYVTLAALLALMVGGLRVLLGLVKAGRVAYLLSEPVVLGFTTAAAILITASQLPKVFDARQPGDGVLLDAFWSLVRVNEWQWQAVAFSVGVAAIMVLGRRIHALFPGALLAVLVALLISEVAGYEGSVVGELSGSFVSLNLDFPWSSAGQLVLPAVAIALVGFAEPASIARTFAAQDRESWSADREFVSQGVANLASGLSGAFPVGGSFSRSSLNRLAGATSPWAGAITGLAVLLAVPLTPALANLPRAVLGAVVIVAVAKLIKVGDLVKLIGQSGGQAVVGIGTLAAVLASAPRVERGVAAGFVLSLLVHLYRELSITVDAEVRDETLVIRPHGVLWFATVPAIDAKIRNHIADNPDVSSILLNLGAVGRLDFSGAAALARISEESAAVGIPVHFSNISPNCDRAARIHLLRAEEASIDEATLDGATGDDQTVSKGAAADDTATASGAR